MNRKQKRLYRTIGFAILFISIGYIVNDQLRKMGNRISGEYLKEFITKESRGLYQIDFQDIDLNILRKSISIAQLTLFATPENRMDSLNAKNIYEAQVANVKISLESVLRIYTEKELVVDGIEVIDPALFMTKINPEKEPLKFGRETGELYDIISEYLDLLQVNYLKVRSGIVNHSPSNFSLKSIDFSVEDFTVSQDQTKKKIFYSEAINLGVNQQSILLPDSIHELSFDGFELSTKDSILNFDNFKISPRKGTDAKQVFEQQNQNIYDIDIPSLELKGINYLKAYEDNFLVVEQVRIPKPKINIQSVLKSAKKNSEQAENSIGASLLALFDLIKIRDFSIEEGGLNLTLKGDNQQRFLSDNISIELFDIELDSTQRDIQNIIHYFENATVEINDYDYLLPDNLHNIKFKKLNFSTIDSLMQVQNLQIKPSRKLKDSTLTQFNLNLPQLIIEGIAHRDIYDNERIDLKNLALTSAEISIIPPYYPDDSIPKTIITPERLYKILGKNFHEIRLKKFSVLNSNLEVGERLSGTAINIQSHHLQIDSSLTSWHEIADSTLINGSNLSYLMQNGTVSVGDFQSKNNLKSLDLMKMNLTYKDLRDQINVDYLSLKGIELDSIINSKKLNIDSITLFKPSLKISYKDLQQGANNKSEWRFPEKPINFNVQKGRLDYQLDQHRNITVANFDIELNYRKELQLFEVTASKLKMDDKQLKHHVYISELSLPKNVNKVALHDISIKPYQIKDSFSISVQLPSINFTNFNKEALFQSKRFEADSMIMNINQLDYTGTTALQNILPQDKQQKNELKFSIQHTSIDLKNSKIDFFNDSKQKNELIISNSQLDLQNLRFPKERNQNFSYSDNFTIRNEKFIYYSAKSDTILIDDLDYSSIDQVGTIKAFNFIGADSTTSLRVENIEINDASLNKYLEENRLEIQKLKSEKTTINFNIANQEKSAAPQKIAFPFKELSISEFDFKDINIKAYSEEKKRNFYVREADLSINTLALDSTLNPKEIHHHINSLVFSGKGYKETFGKHYTVFADDYIFRYPESSFKARNIKMRSKYDRFEYSEHIEFQNDWFKLDIASLDLKQLNIDSVLISKKFILKKLAVNQADLIVFRDLNIPHNRDQKVPMPQKVLAKSDIAFSVDSVFVNSNIHIHIVPKESSGIGTMTINIDSGFVNDMRTHHFDKVQPMILQAKGRLNEKAEFNTIVDFPIPSDKGEFQFVGNIGSMDLKILNEMLIPLGAIEVRSGFNEEVNINFKGNDDYAEGAMNFRYSNLKIDILDRETYQSKGFGNNIKTIFANSFVVSNKNPRWFKLQEGNIFFERIKSRSIFNLWAKSLLSGAVSSIGIKKSKEEAKAYYKENKEEVDRTQN